MIMLSHCASPANQCSGMLPCVIGGAKAANDLNISAPTAHLRVAQRKKCVPAVLQMSVGRSPLFQSSDHFEGGACQAMAGQDAALVADEAEILTARLGC